MAFIILADALCIKLCQWDAKGRGVLSKGDDIKNYKIQWSDLNSKVADDEHTIEVHIFRGVADTNWTLEIIDPNDESTI